MEKKYSLIITPPEEISRQIKIEAEKICNNSNFTPYITLHSSFSSNRTDFIEKTRNWLEDQNPFVFTLRKIDSFSKPAIVYLTSGDEVEIEEINELYFGLKSLLENEVTSNCSTNSFVPHLTLDTFCSQKKFKNAKINFKRFFQNPIPLPIVKIDVAERIGVTEKIGDFRWKTIDCLRIGRNEDKKQLVTADEYRFNQINRASIFPDYTFVSE